MAHMLSWWNVRWVFMFFRLTWLSVEETWPAGSVLMSWIHFAAAEIFSLTELQGHASIFIPNFRHFRALTKGEWGDETRVDGSCFPKAPNYFSVWAVDAYSTEALLRFVQKYFMEFLHCWHCFSRCFLMKTSLFLKYIYFFNFIFLTQIFYQVEKTGTSCHTGNVKLCEKVK